MPRNILFSAHQKRHRTWLPGLGKELSRQNIEAELVVEPPDKDSVHYIIHAPDGPVSDFSGFRNLQAVLSLWAGVEEIVGNPTLKVPLVRMVDPGMVEGMVEWVTAQVLRYHIGMDAHIRNRSGQWLKHLSPPLARHRVVGMLGLGSLGQACLRSLASLNFQLLGWSRTPKSLPCIRTYCGEAGLRKVLAEADIVVLLVPLTPATTNLFNRKSLAFAKPGLSIINSGRGALIDDDALLDALDCGRISHATLDVFRIEPLPPEHPFWANERISIWPHIASETRVETAARILVRNIARHMNGGTLENVVNIQRGY